MLPGVAHLAHVWVDHGVFAFHYDCEHEMISGSSYYMTN